MATQSSSNELEIPPIISDDDEENISLPKKVRKKLLIDSSDEEVMSVEGVEKDIEEDLESKSEEDESLSGEDDEDESIEGEDSDEAEDDDEEENSDELDSDESESSLLSFDSEFSWDEFQYIDDNAENSFIQDEEESIRERYNTVMKSLLSEQSEEGFDSLSILYEEPLIQKQLISDFANFDWEKAKSQFVKNCEPKMRMLTFGITRALARFARNPTLFYLQALSLRPTDKALWYEFGCASARLHNLKTSELAFKQCISPYSDAGIKLAIVYFYSKDYHKCLPLLREMLTSRPNNLALWVIKSEISKINIFWKYYVELYFPSNSLFFQEPTIPSEVYEKVLQEICSFDSADPPTEKFRSDYSIEPLLCEPIRLNVDQPVENFATLLCKYFDQSSKQQLPFQQNVHFAKEKRHHHSNRLNSSSLNGSIKEPTPLPDCDSLSVLSNDETDAACSSVTKYMVNILEDVQSVVEKLVNDVVQGKIPKPIKTKRRPPRKNPNLSLDVRRSGRTSKEIPFEAMDSPVIGTFQQPTNTEPVTIRTLLDLPSGETTFQPLDFPGARGFPFDDFTCNIIPSFALETFNVYLTTLLNKQHLPMEELLRTFLYFFSWNLPSGCQLTVEQRKLFLEVYIRWTETFCQPFHQHCINASVKIISIHLLALELDVDEKLKAVEACEAIFARFFGILQKQKETSLKLNVIQKREEAISEKAMRNKAIKLLSEVDPEMAAKIKSCMEESRVSSKALSKDLSIEDAIGTLTFSRDDYFSAGLKPIRQKAKKHNILIVESQEKPCIELLDKDESDLTTLTAFDICEPCLAEPSTTNAELNSKFITLWADLSKIMQKVVKSTLKEANDEETNEAIKEREMSPMDESDMISLLNDCSGFSDGEDDNIFQRISDIQEGAPNNENVQHLLKVYMTILESFVDENKHKKEIEADLIATFMDETKKIIEAMETVLNQSSIHKDIEMEEEEDENEKLREMAVRFYWFKVMKFKDSENTEHKKAYLSTILHLIELDKPIYTQLRDKNEMNTVITARDVIEMLMHEFRNEKIRKIAHMIAEKKHEEVISEFTTDFNWYSCNENEIISNIQILLSCFEAVKDRKGPVEWICRLLDRVISGKFGSCRDDIYLKSLQQLERLNLEEIDHEVLKLLARRLVVFSEFDRFKKNVQLWRLLYRVASIIEGSYDENSRIEMYQSIEACKSLMPTKALCLLVEGHRILGEEHHCCTLDNGELLYFFIDELYKNYYNSRFEDHYYSKLVQRNIELQLIQCLKCLFDSSIGKSVVYDHECSKNLNPTIAVAKKVQPFLIPNLPMFDDEKFTTNDVIEALTRVFPFIEHEKVSGFDQAWAKFEIFIKDPPFFKFEIKDSELRPVGDFAKANLWPCVEITAENREKLELFVYLRYVLLVIKYKKQNYSWEENQKLSQLAKECLVLSGSPDRKLLPVKVIHSLWAICAYTHTMHFCYLEDDELAKQANSYFYMFKMAFLQYSKAFQLHIDIACAYYQINSRIRRHKRSLPDNSLPEEVESKVAREDMIKQCQLHFNQFSYRISQTNEYPKDISWIEAYFAGKIGEHNERPPSEIFEHYYRCAMLMRAEAYTYPLRVNKTTQENVEPLELHYRVHVYAMKQIFAMEKIKPFERRIEQLKIIRYYLRLFLGHFVFAKKNPQPLPAVETSLPFVDSTPPWDFEEKPEMADEGEEYYDDEVEDTLELMVTYTDLKVECIEYCHRAFETIVKRFPHYKSFYQLALLHLINSEFQQGLDIIFGKLFKGKFVSFEVTDIERTDIERSDTLAYHIKKMIRLTLALLMKCRDIPKTNSVLEDLVRESSSGRMKLKPRERTNFISVCLEIYQEAVGKVIRSKNIEQINALVKHLEKASSILRTHKQVEIDEKVKAQITRCRNTIRGICEAREKQRNKEMAASQLQALMEVQKMIAAKQKQDLTEKIKLVAEEQVKKQKEEEEKKRKAAQAEKRNKETSEAQKNLLAYQKIVEAKKAEEAKRAKEAGIMKLVTEKLNRIVNNPLLSPALKKQVEERKPALIDALKVNVEKGESLATLINQLDKFDNSLKKSPASTQATTTAPCIVQQAERNGTTALNSVQRRQPPIPRSLNWSTTPSTSASSAAALPKSSGIDNNKGIKAASTALSRTALPMPQITPQKASVPQPKTTLQIPSSPTPQKSPSSSSSKASTPSKTAVDDNNSREQVINEIAKLIQQYAPNDLNNLQRLRPTMLRKSTQELQQVYSSMFVQYICKTSAVPTTSSNISINNTTVNVSGKRTAAQVSPSTASNIVSKIRRTDNSLSASTFSNSAANAIQIPQKPSQPISQSRNAVLQTSTVSSTQTSQHSSGSVSKAARFDHLAEQVKKAIPKTIPSSSGKTTTSMTTATTTATSDDDVMIIGETKSSSASSSKTTVKHSACASASPSLTQKSSVTKKISDSDRRKMDLVNSIAAQKKPSQYPSSTSRFLQNPVSSKSSQIPVSRTQLQAVNSQPRNALLQSSVPTTATSTASNVTPAVVAQFANNLLVQQQMQHLLQNATPEQREQILQAFLQPPSHSNQSSTNQKR